MPSTRVLLPSIVLDGKIYLIGGRISGNVGPIRAVLVYDPAADEWADGAEMPTARGDLATAVVDNKIYAIGGHTGITWGAMGEVFDTVEEYAPEGLEGLESTKAAVSPQGKKPLTWGEVKSD